MQIEKTIKNKAEVELARRIGFRGKYVLTLLESAAKHLKLEGENRLSDAKAYLREMDRRHAAKIKEVWNLSPRTYARLREKAREILRSFTSGYSMGEHKQLVIDSYRSFVRVDNTREYARSSRYKALHGELTVTMNLTELRNIERIEGVWTVRCGNGKAKWLKATGAKSHCRVGWVYGYCVGSSHGASLEECHLLEAGKAVRAEDGKVKRLDRFVGLRDRVFAGACEAGVLAFCQRHQLNPEFGYRIDFLVSLGDETANQYLRRLAMVKGV